MTPLGCATNQTLPEGLLAQRILSEDEIKRIFSNLDEIILAEEALLAALEEVNAKEDVPPSERGWGKAYADQVCGYDESSLQTLNLPFRKRHSRSIMLL